MYGESSSNCYSTFTTYECSVKLEALNCEVSGFFCCPAVEFTLYCVVLHCDFAAEENIVQACTWYIDFINTAADVLIGTINTQSKIK